MAKYRLNELERRHGDLHSVIPELVNRLGQHRTAQQLGVSSFTINHWLKANGYVRVIRYEQRESENKSA